MDTTERMHRPDYPGNANERVAATIRAEMAKRQISTTELGDRLRASGPFDTPVDPRFLRRRLSSTIELTITDVQWIALALNVPLADLLADATPHD